MSLAALDYETMSEPDLVAQIRGGDVAAARLLIRRNNQRLFRAAWSVLRDRAEAEEAVQEGYLKAFAGLARFDQRASLTTWLTRIVVNEAISRLRARQRRERRLREQGLAVMQDYRDGHGAPANAAPSPEAEAMRGQVARLLEGAIARLPEPFRLVFVLHEVEGLSAEEVAAALGSQVETVRTRLFRARRRLREDLGPELRRALDGVVPFAGVDCDGLTARVLAAVFAARPAD